MGQVLPPPLLAGSEQSGEERRLDLEVPSLGWGWGGAHKSVPTRKTDKLPKLYFSVPILSCTHLLLWTQLKSDL